MTRRSIQTTPTPVPGQMLTVSAANDVRLQSYGGSLGGSLVGGVGGSVDVGLVRNDTVATIGDRVTIKAADGVTVEATSTKDVDSVIASAAVGSIGVAGAVGVYSLGDNLDTSSRGLLDTEAERGGDDHAEYDSVQAYVDAQLQDDTGSDLLNGSDDENIQDAADDATATRSSLGISSSVLAGSDAESGTVATVGDDVRIESSGAVEVVADDDTSFNSIIGAASLSFVGLGAGIGVVETGADVIASVGSGTTILAADTATVAPDTTDRDELTIVSDGLSVRADRDLVSHLDTFAGSASSIVGLNGSVAVVSDEGDTTATLESGAAINRAVFVQVAASDDRDLHADATGGSIAGIAAAGASIADAKVDGGAYAVIDRGVQIGQADNEGVGGVDVAAFSDVSAEADSKALAAGIFAAGNGSTARVAIGSGSSDTFDTAAVIAAGDVSVTDDVTVTANSASDSNANAGAAVIALGANTGVSVFPKPAAITPSVQRPPATSALATKCCLRRCRTPQTSPPTRWRAPVL